MAKKVVDKVEVMSVVDESPLVELVLAIGQQVPGAEVAIAEYDTAEHDVFKIAKRPKKPVQSQAVLKTHKVKI